MSCFAPLTTCIAVVPNWVAMLCSTGFVLLLFALFLAIFWFCFRTSVEEEEETITATAREDYEYPLAAYPEEAVPMR